MSTPINYFLREMRRVLTLRTPEGETGHTISPDGPYDLEGDRAIEWSWVVAHLPPPRCQILDFGCVQSALAGIAARLGHQVTAVDLREIEYEMDNVVFLRGDINELNLGGKRFDIIMNCSTVEHAGLGGRYGAKEQPNGDLMPMQKLHALLKQNGRMLLTIPVGLDATFSLYHRVYGVARLPLLLEGYHVQKSEFWIKLEMKVWKRCDMDVALKTTGSGRYYVLGLFILARRG